MNKKIDQHDIDAEREGMALKHSHRLKSMDFGKRLKPKRYDDGIPVNTGEKHRAINRSH